MTHVLSSLRRARRRFRRGEDGATVVEYALFVGLLVIGTMAGITSLEDDAETYYVDVSNDIGDLPQNAIPVLTLPDGTPITTTTQATTTTTSSTTSSSSTTTTTTTAPTSTTTTTTAPTTTTTTTPPAETSITQLLDRSQKKNNKSWWRARVRVTLTDTETGDRVPGAKVTGNFAGNGTKQCVTNNNGRCNLSTNIDDDDASVLFSVTAVDADPDWDQSSASILLYNPE